MLFWSPPMSKEPGMHTPSHAAHSGHYFTKHLTHTGRKIHSLCHSKIGASGRGNRTPSLITGTLFGRWNSSSWFLWDHSGKATSTYICHHCLHLLLGFLPWTTRITWGGFQSTFGTWWPYVHESRRSRAILTGQVCGAEDKHAIFCNTSR